MPGLVPDRSGPALLSLALTLRQATVGGLTGNAGGPTLAAGQEQTVSRLPVRPTNLTLEDMELVSKSGNLSLKPDLRLVAGEQGVQEEADDNCRGG